MSHHASLESIPARINSAPMPVVDPSAPTVGVVFEGGGYRGMYTEGVFDVWMRNGITATHTVGVSAGATFGCNFKSLQLERAARYNMRFVGDSRYAGFGSFLRTGNFFNKDFAFGRLPWELDVFDTEAYAKNPMRFTLVATDANTGESVYHDVMKGDKEDVEWMRASAAIPGLSRPVELEGRKLLDGGTSDSIPYEWMLSQGYDRCVVVLTQDKDYQKEPNDFMWFLKIALRKYPAIIELLANRHIRYNEQRKKLFELEREGKVFVIMPSEPVRVPVSIKDPAELQHVYDVGKRDGEATLEALKAYLS